MELIRKYECVYKGEVAYQVDGIEATVNEEGIEKILLKRHAYEDWRITEIIRTKNISEEFIRELQKELRDALSIISTWEKDMYFEIKVEQEKNKKLITVIKYKNVLAIKDTTSKSELVDAIVSAIKESEEDP